MNMQVSSLRGEHLDLALTHSDIFATVEFKELELSSIGHWVISGLSKLGVPSMLLTLSAPMLGTSEAELIIEATAFAERFLFPMAQELARTPGAGDRILPLSVGNRRMLFEAHMKHHFSQNRAGNLSLQVQTEALFKMATRLEVVAPLKLIAEFQGVAVSTVETRIKIARAAGRIPKASEVRARTNTSKKGD